jgi:hypothetical protein
LKPSLNGRCDLVEETSVASEEISAAFDLGLAEQRILAVC